jgi:hypothetical protein
MRKWIRVCAAVAVVALGACSFDDILQVDNPDAIQLDALDDVELAEVQVNGVVDQFYSTYVGTVIEYAGYPTDEVLTGLNWEDYARVSQRIISYLEGPTAGIFEGLSKGLRMGDEVAERIRGWIPDNPSKNLQDELALTLAIAGYSAVVLAENMCQAVVSPDADDPSGTVLSQLETFGVALPYLEEALSTAQAAGESDIANLARTGLARAHLGMGNWSEAANYAMAVEPGFEWWIPFIDVSGGRNPLHGTSHGGNFTLGIHPWFTGTHPSFDGTGYSFRDDDIVDVQTDPRIQHAPTDITGHNGLTPLYKLYQGLRYSDYTGETLAPASAECPDCTGTDPDDMELLAEYSTNVLLADYTEAQHHYYEALAMQGGNDGAVLDFVNERRAFGNQPPVTLSGQDLITELRNQRGRDLFMGGFRLPDLRRWTRFDAGNGPFDAGSYFPTGTHPNSQWGPYEDWTCFPIPLSEYEGNPNLEKPIDPNVPPGI